MAREAKKKRDKNGADTSRHRPAKATQRRRCSSRRAALTPQLVAAHVEQISASKRKAKPIIPHLHPPRLHPDPHTTLGGREGGTEGGADAIDGWRFHFTCTTAASCSRAPLARHNMVKVGKHELLQHVSERAAIYKERKEGKQHIWRPLTQQAAILNPSRLSHLTIALCTQRTRETELGDIAPAYCKT